MHRIVRVLAAAPLALASLASGCASTPAPAAAPQNVRNFEPPAAPESAKCYMGPVNAGPPGGPMMTGGQYLVRRWWVPETSTIFEDLVIYSSAGTAPMRFSNRYVVSGSTFVLDELKGTYNGTGTFLGEPGAWTTWHVDASTTGGGKTSAEYKLTEQGIQHDSKVFNPGETDDEGKPQVLAEGHAIFQPLDSAQCEEKFAKAPKL